MKKSVVALFAVVVLLAACQKGADLKDPDAAQKTASATQLVRMVEVEGADSSVIAYAYDTAGRLSQFDAEASSTTVALSCKLTRNAAGLLTQAVIKSDDWLAVGVDSIITRYYSNAATLRYTYSRYDFVYGGVLESDSTVYTYDAGGRISRDVTYDKSAAGPYRPSGRTDYSYTGNNITKQERFDYDMVSASWVLALPTTYAYDTKANPLKMGSESVLIAFVANAGDNNYTQEQSVSPSGGTTTVTCAYAYNADGKPVSGTRVIASSSAASTSTLRFYYR